MSSVSTHSAHSNSIHYHTQSGRTLVYNIEDAADYGITLSPIPSQTETLVTETFHAKEHVLARPETSQFIHRKLCHQLPSIEERMRNCLHSSSEVINSYLSDSRELLQSTPMSCNVFSIHDRASLGSHPAEKGHSDYNFHDFTEDDRDFNDSSSLSDGVNASFAVIEDFAKVLEETSSVFEEVDCDGFDDQWSISDDKVRRIVGIVKRHNEKGSWDPEKVSSSEVIEFPHPKIHYAEKVYPDEYMEELLADKISFENDLQLPSIFNNRSPNSATSTGRNTPIPSFRESSGNTSPRLESETSEGSVLVNMIQDYVKMVMDVSLALCHSAQTKAPKGSVSGFSPVSNVVGKEGEAATMYTSQTDIENVGVENTFDNGSLGHKETTVQQENLVLGSERREHEAVSSGEQSPIEVQYTEQVANVDTGNEFQEIDRREETSDEDVKLGPIGPRKSSVEKWESVTLRAERLLSGEHVEAKTKKLEIEAEPLVQSNSKEASSSEFEIITLPNVLHASESNFMPPSDFFLDVVTEEPTRAENGTSQHEETVLLAEVQTNATDMTDYKEFLNTTADVETTHPSETADLLQTQSSSSVGAEVQAFNGSDTLSNDIKLDDGRNYDESETDKDETESSTHKNTPPPSEVAVSNNYHFEESEEGPHIVFYQNVEESHVDNVIENVFCNLETTTKFLEQKIDDTSSRHEESVNLIAPQEEVEETAFFPVNRLENHEENNAMADSDDSDPCDPLAAISQYQVVFLKQPAEFDEEKTSGSQSDQVQSETLKVEDSVSVFSAHPDLQTGIDYQTTTATTPIALSNHCDSIGRHSEVNLKQNEAVLSFVNSDLGSNTNPISLHNSMDNNFPEFHEGQLRLQEEQESTSEEQHLSEPQNSLDVFEQQDESLPSSSTESGLELEDSGELENVVLTALNEMMDRLDNDGNLRSVDHSLEELDAEKASFERIMPEEDLRSCLETVLERVSDQFPETDVREAHDALYPTSQHLPKTIPTELSDHNNSGNFSENISQDGNDQEADPEITGTLDSLLSSVAPESEHVSSSTYGESDEQTQKLDSREEKEESEERSATEEEEDPIEAEGHLLDDVQHQDILDVLERCLDILEALEYLTETVSSDISNSTIVELTEMEEPLDNNSEYVNHLTAISEDLFAHVQEPGVWQEEKIEDERMDEYGHKNTPDKETHGIWSEEEECRTSNIAKPQFYETYSGISSGSSGTDEMISGDITDVILSVVCIVDVVETMMDDVVKLLETVSNTSDNGSEHQSKTGNSSIIEDWKSDGPNDIESASLAFERENWSEEEFFVEEKNEQISSNVQECLASIVSVVEAVETLLEAASLMNFESQLEDKQLQFEFALDAIAEEDLSNHKTSFQEERKDSKTVKMGMPEPVSMCEIDPIPGNLFEPAPLELQQLQQLHSDTSEEIEYFTFTLDQILSVVEVVQDLLNDVVNLETSVKCDSAIPEAISIMPERTLMNSVGQSKADLTSSSLSCENLDKWSLLELQGSAQLHYPDLKESESNEDLEQATSALDEILAVVEVVQNLLVEVVNLEAAIQLEKFVISETITIVSEVAPRNSEVSNVEANILEINQEYVLKPESMEKTTEEVGTPCALEPIVQNCEIFLSSLKGTPEHEPDQKCSVISEEVLEVFESLEASPNQSHIDKQSVCNEGLGGCETSDVEGISDGESCQNQLEALKFLVREHLGIHCEFHPPTAEDIISDYVEQLVDQQLFEAMAAASQSVIGQICAPEAPRQFYQDYLLINETSEDQSVHCSPTLTNISSSVLADSIPTNQDSPQREEKCDNCFEEIADDNQNFEIAVPCSAQLQNPMSPTHIPPFPSETSETSEHDILTDTPILNSHLLSHEISDYTLSPEQTKTFTASKSLVSEISDDGNDDDGSRNNTWNITGTCQQLQLERARPTQPRQHFDDAIYPGYDLMPESSDCSLCVEIGDPVPTNSSQKLPSETSPRESSLKPLEQPTTSSVLEEVSHFLTTACVTALVFMSPPDSSSAPFNSDIIEDASKYISSKPELNKDGQS